MASNRRKLSDRESSRIRRHRQRRVDCAVRELESRVMLSVTARIAGGVAAFTGDQAPDSLYLRVNPSNQLEYSTDGVIYTNKLSGQIFTFSQTRRRLIATLGGGDDSLNL